MNDEEQSSFPIDNNDYNIIKKKLAINFDIEKLIANLPPEEVAPAGSISKAEAFARLNSICSMVNYSGKAVILKTGANASGDNHYELMKPSDFRAFTANIPSVFLGYNEKGKAVFERASEFWLTHHRRNTYDGLIFQPEGGESDKWLNTFKGLPYSVTETGAFELMHAHIVNVICNGDKQLAEYLFKWIAYPLQNLGFKTGVIPILKGQQGTGKGIFVSFIGRLYGDYYQYVNSSDKVVGKFNAHLAESMFVFCDEAFFSGDKKSQSALKSLVTDEYIQIERKGFDSVRMKNYLNFIFASNEEAVIPLEKSDRRYLIIDVSEKRDREYFNALAKEASSTDAIQGFYNYLMGLDLTDFSVQDFPRNKQAEFNERISGLDSIAHWCLYFIAEIDTMPNYYGARELFNLYRDYCSSMKLTKFEIRTETEFGGKIATLFGWEKKRTSNGKYYFTTSLKDTVDTLNDKLGIN